MRKSALQTSFKHLRQPSPLWRWLVCALSLTAPYMAATGLAFAERIINPVAVFNGLDKITGRIVSFEVAVNETIQFGSLQLTPRACYTRPPTEAPNTTAFIEADELNEDNRAERLFTGWVFAASPGLHGIEHPVYDIWLVDCQGGNIAPIRAAEDNNLNTRNNGNSGKITSPDDTPGHAAINDSVAGNDNAIKVGDIDPYAPPPPPPRPPFEQQEDMQLDIDTLQTPLRDGQPADLLFSPQGE